MDRRLAEGVVLQRAGEIREAAELYVAVLKDDPDDADALSALGSAMSELGHHTDALSLLDRALRVRKRDLLALFRRAETYVHLGRMDDAVADLKRMIRLDPNGVDGWNGLALAELHRGNLEAAEEAARRGQPGTLGTVRLARGDRLGAVRAFGTALLDQPSTLGAIAFTDAVFPLADPPADLGEALEMAYAHDGVDHSRLDRATRAALAPLRDDPEALASSPLFQRWLTRSTPFHPDWEPALRATRRWLADQTLARRDLPDVAVTGFAFYGWRAEYPWPEEPELVERLNGGHIAQVAARAMYAPIPKSWHREGWEHLPLSDLVGLTHEDGARERRLAAAIPNLTEDDDTSGVVRAMYEENPYPRLVSVHLRPGDGLAATLQTVLGRTFDVPSAPEVLVAGCGTGQHLIQSAVAWPEATVLGVDLSLASLGRAAATIQELEVLNASVARADLLRVGSIGRTFDVVEAVGVLHHLEDPLAGWRALRDVTRPGGFMRIGLYSEASRTDIAAARALIAELGLEATPSGIREARERILALPVDHPARPVLWSPDFASLTGCRDLLFHVREHLYTFPRLQAEIEALGLELLGFQHAFPNAPALYRERWPEDARMVDLRRWAEIEAANPRLFSGMYVFWVRR